MPSGNPLLDSNCSLYLIFGSVSSFLVDLPGLPRHLVVDAEHAPVGLHQPPPARHEHGVPAVPVAAVHKLLAGEVLAGLAVMIMVG